MKIAVLAAMEKELAALKASGIDAVQIGIGKVNASMTATRLILNSRPDCIISTGCAGGLAPFLKRGDFVVGSRVAYHDVWCGEGNLPGQVQGCPMYFNADPVLLSKAEALEPDCGRLFSGLIACGDQFYISPEENQRILSVLPEALATDMESAAVAQVCLSFGVPFISLRIISDTQGSEIEQETSYKDFWDNTAKYSFNLVEQLINAI